MGLGETIATDICGYEARAVQMCVLNIDLKKRPTKIRFFNRHFLPYFKILKDSLRQHGSRVQFRAIHWLPTPSRKVNFIF